MAIKNPLRYPGAKSKLYDYVKSLLEQEDLIGCTFYEPFAGSSALSLKLLENGLIKNAVLNERDPLIYNFWRAVFNHTDELLTLIDNTEISLEQWHRLSAYRDTSSHFGKTTAEIGFAGLFLNRTNFSGILNANPIGGKNQSSEYLIDCRFNKDAIKKSILDISAFRDNITVQGDDAILFMQSNLHYKRHNSFFVYIDPPYYKAGPQLYRYYYTHNDHLNLARYIKPKTFSWLMSYDDDPEIRKMYNSNKFVNLYLDYSVRTSRKGSELLISNLEIPPLTNEELKDNKENLLSLA